jgi:GH25 family lysozyme M1 (1,4-beta-N-acetylmuramidase)
VRGVDLSHYNGLVDWGQFASSGNSFVFEKASEGVAGVDNAYSLNRAGAAADGLRFGAYHFARPAGSGLAGITANAETQADHFVAIAQPQPQDLLPVLDLEKTGGLPGSGLAAWAQAWLDEVQARLGVKPLIYTGLNFWHDALADTDAFARQGYRLWFARYTALANPLAPAGNWGGLGWTFWQWSSCAHAVGITGCVDADRYRSTDLTPVTIPTPVPLAPAIISAPRIVGAATTKKLLAAVTGLWHGAEPTTFSYRWQRCDAAGGNCLPIPAATGHTYTPLPADIARTLVVSVTATNSAGTATAASAPTTAVVAAGTANPASPTSVSAPRIIGTPAAGRLLTSTVGSWRGAPSKFSYQWRRCNQSGTGCTSIKSAIATTYTPLAPDIGHTISLRVAATNAAGTTSATTAPTAPVLAAPIPPPLIGSQLAAANQAGAITTVDGAVTVSWQPGAIAAGTTVALTPAPKAIRTLALPQSAVVLSLRTATGQTQTPSWPLDLSFAVNPTGAIAGIQTSASFWHPARSLRSPLLPHGVIAGSYTDTSGHLHVLTISAATLALFHAGGWGDPRFASSLPPRILRADHSLGPLLARSQPGHRLVVKTRISVDTQARMSASLLGSNGQPLPLLPGLSSFGTRLRRPAQTIQLLALTPGARTVNLAIHSRSSTRPRASYRIRVIALDPYGRRGQLVLRVLIPRPNRPVLVRKAFPLR